MEKRRGMMKVLIPMVRKVMPNLIAHEIVGVQPMSGPLPGVFSLTKEKHDAYKEMKLKYNIPGKDD